jgi:hypothetical protein
MKAEPTVVAKLAVARQAEAVPEGKEHVGVEAQVGGPSVAAEARGRSREN